MQIAPSVIEQIKDKTDLVQLVSQYLKLKRSGSNYFAKCPFHKEKSGSFSINTHGQYYHCFGCGASGNAINFLMQYNGVDFISAVKTLADAAGVIIPSDTPRLTKDQVQELKQHKADLDSTIKLALEFYQINLANSNLANNYLTDRGLTSQIIKHFNLGFIPYNKSLSNVFSDYSTNKLLIDAGLVIKTDDNRVYDRFRDRIIFPIKSQQGRIIGFGGRIITQGEPKYLNSPETQLFDKSSELYGLYEAGKSIREQKYSIVVEGYFDVISLHQHGITNAVASMGTSVSASHIKKLFQLANDIYFCFDGDNAGRVAAWKALDRAIGLVNDSQGVYFLFLSKEHDPDSFINEFGATVFINKLKAEALPLSVFLLKQLALEINLVTDEGKAKLISLTKPFIERIKAVALQVMLKKSLAKYVELDASSIESILNNRSKYAFYNVKWQSRQPISQVKLPEPNLNLVEIAAHYALHNINMVASYKLPHSLESYNQATRELILLLDYISYAYVDDQEVNLDDLLAQISFQIINIKRAYDNSVLGDSLSIEEFHQCLDKVFAINKIKVTKIPKIPMRSDK